MLAALKQSLCVCVVVVARWKRRNDLPYVVEKKPVNPSKCGLRRGCARVARAWAVERGALECVGNRAAR